MLKRKEEPLANRWKLPCEADSQKIDNALTLCCDKVRENISVIGGKSPSDITIDGKYALIDNNIWTTGFYPGMLWIAYAFTGNEIFLKAGKAQTESFLYRCENDVEMNNHDVGFCYSCSAVADYILTGDEKARTLAIEAAYKMSELYMHKAGVINRGGGFSTKEAETEMFIIDCMNNTPLLFWAAEQTGDRVLSAIAYNHMKNSSQLQILECGAVCQVGIAEIKSGKLYRNWDISQGKCGTDAVWSRGQAWAVSGLPLTYSYTRDEMFLTYAKRVANFFLNSMPEDKIAPWDLYYTDNETQKDTSASAIAACGLLELAEYCDKEESQIYKSAAIQIINRLIDRYMVAADKNTMGILGGGTYQMTCDKGVNVPIIFGDYYFMEALFRLTDNFKKFW